MPTFGEIYAGELAEDDVGRSLEQALQATGDGEVVDLEARIRGGGAFELTVFFGKPDPSGGKVAYGWASYRDVGEPALLDVLAWLRAHKLPLKVTLDVAWTPLSRAGRLELVRKVYPGCKLVRVDSSWYAPASERGEEPWGSFSLALVIRTAEDIEARISFGGDRFSEQDAAEVKKNLALDAEELARLAGVAVNQ